MTDHREVAPFARVELAGANTVVIHVGATAVGCGDRRRRSRRRRVTTVVPMAASSSTTLAASRRTRGYTSTIDGVTGADFGAELAGNGTLAVPGTVQGVTAVLAGRRHTRPSCSPRTDATAQLTGTGTIRVHATSTLDATLAVTGTIRATRR